MPSMEEEEVEEADNQVLGESYYHNITELIDSLLDDPALHKLIPEISSLKDSYKKLNTESRILFIRLYMRRRHWLRRDSFAYKDVSDIQCAVEQLLKERFLVQLKDCQEETTVETLLSFMNLKELKGLAKNLNLKQGNKTILRSAILDKCNKQKTLFGGVAETRKRIKRSCCTIVGDLIRVGETALDKVLIASFPQYSCSLEEDDKDSFTGKGNLSRILLSQFGLARSFPSYKISFTKPIFDSSLSLEAFLNECKLEARCYAEIDKSNWRGLQDIHDENIDRFRRIVEEWSSMTELPADFHLLHYTEHYILARVMRQCLAALQRLKMYDSAVSLLRLLLQYKLMVHRRGAWWETLSLIQDFHLKDRKAALLSAEEGLRDPHTTHGCVIALETRLKKLQPGFTPSFTFQHKEVTIEVVKMIEGDAVNDIKSRRFYVGYEGDDVVLLDVEGVVLNYYINNSGFKEGCHAEGSIVSTLFGIFCWDIIFCDVDNVFYNQYQYHPLDFFSPQFYMHRKTLFEERFELLNQMKSERLNKFIDDSWNLHYQQGCVGVNWDLFKDLTQCQRCVTCMTPTKLVGMFREYLTDPRLKRSGLPDLSMWNIETQEFRFVEVKGPNDTLRNNQRHWLKVLNDIELAAEVCHVKAISRKRL